jgi:hypothetical protein
MTARTRNPCFLLTLPVMLMIGIGGVRAADPPDWLPRYDVGVRLDVDRHLVSVIERVTWTNHHQLPSRELIFNAHAHYAVPKGDIGLLAKTLELLRMAPSEAMSFDGPPLAVKRATLVKETRRQGEGETRRQGDKERGREGDKEAGGDLPLSPSPSLPLSLSPSLPFSFASDNDTALVVQLPCEIGPGESVTIDLEFVLKLPQKKGRWGQWGGVTTLAQWLPVLAFYDHKGWQPTPFIPWHQPFFNEAGFYTVRVDLPSDQKLACSGVVRETSDLGNGWTRIETAPQCLRDFALIASAQFQEHTGKVGDVVVRCLALPIHAYYGEKAVQIACEAIPVYNRWFGPYPYTQFTIVEAYFGWNGNECGGLIMIDERMFGMPHVTSAYLDSLISHELCHQWWYNVVGTNGYSETWMDEGMATYFSHRIQDQKIGKNNNIINYPKGLEWAPNIAREDLRNYGYRGALSRGDAGPTVQDMPKFRHLGNLMAMTYDRGSKIVGMIEQRLGEAAFLDFMRLVYSKYQFRILRVADFQRELEAYTGRSWDAFFQDWLYGSRNTDWAIGKVEIERQETGEKIKDRIYSVIPPVLWPESAATQPTTSPVRVRVWVEQRGDTNEPTVLGFRLANQKGYQIRVPVADLAEPAQYEEVSATVYPEEDASSGLLAKKAKSYKVEITLPGEPAQISIDPDQVLLDSNAVNNHWRPEVRIRATPLYTQLDEVDVTNAYDRWNVILGPYAYANAYNDPWFVRSPIFGFKAGLYKTQELDAGVFTGYRTNDMTIVAGAEAYWDHLPLPHMQIGFIYEKALETIGPRPDPIDRGVLYLRYVLTYGSSLYLPPFEYIEGFASGGNRSLPQPYVQQAGSDLFNDQYALGVHYHKMYETPYWDPEGGLALDASYQYGFPILGDTRPFQQVYGQVSTVKYLPEWLTNLSDGPVMSYLKETRVAMRLAGAAALPNDGLFFTLGGGDFFRGYDLSQRQGSMMWVGSLEWRLPVARNLDWDFVDHVAGIRNIYLAPFYDVGDAYVNNHSYGPVAQAVGVGLRVDTAWLGLIERTMLRLDVAKTVNDATPFQFWVGISHPF